MNVLMYPIAPDDDFPDEFCAIRQGSGEHWFYTPVGEDASWMLFRAESENAKLRELAADAWGYISHPANATWTHEKRKEVRDSIGDRMRELGVDA